MKYRFKIRYQSDLLKKGSELMRKLDTNIEDFFFEQWFEFTTREEYEISSFKEAIKVSFDTLEYKVLKIEGGKFE